MYVTWLKDPEFLQDWFETAFSLASRKCLDSKACLFSTHFFFSIESPP
jgi:hypothetical protein